MADGVAISPGVGTTVSTEEVTHLNGSPVPAQHVQRVALVGITADGTVIDLGIAANPLLVETTTAPVTSITRDSTGRITAFVEAGTTHTVTRDSGGRVSAVS